MSRTPRMHDAVRHLAGQLERLRPGRMDAGFLASFRVEVGGTAVSLSRLGTLTTQGQRVLVRPFDAAHVGAIAAALTAARLDAYAADARTVAVAIPAPSPEQRAELARHVRKLGEEARIAVRMARQEERKRIEARGRGSLRGVQEATDASVAEIERLVRVKLAELET